MSPKVRPFAAGHAPRRPVRRWLVPLLVAVAGLANAQEAPESAPEQAESAPEPVEAEAPSLAAASREVGAEESGPTADFRVFNTLLYQDMPAIGTRLPLVTGSRFYTQAGASPTSRPSSAGIEQAVAEANAQTEPPWRATPELATVVLKRWRIWPQASLAEHERSMLMYADTLSRFRAEVGMPVCIQGVLPEAGLPTANRSTRETEVRAEWSSATAQAAAKLLPHVDALCLSLYTYNLGETEEERAEHLERWRIFARETIAEARKVAEDRPVYAILWPQFHPGGNVTDGSFIPADYWRAELETVRELADGVILQGGWDPQAGERMRWDAQADWWLEFREVFAAELL